MSNVFVGEGTTECSPFNRQVAWSLSPAALQVITPEWR